MDLLGRLAKRISSIANHGLARLGKSESTPLHCRRKACIIR